MNILLSGIECILKVSNTVDQFIDCKLKMMCYYY